MPHLRIRGMKIEEVQEISNNLIVKLVDIINVPKDHFTLELTESTFVFEGEINKNRYPFVNVDWFKRDEGTMKQVAEVITSIIKEFDYEDVAVYFNDLDKGNYYENGDHF